MKGLNLKPKHKAYIALGLTALIGGYILYNRNKKKKLIKEIHAIMDGDISSGSVPSTLKKEDVAKLPMGQFPLKLGQANQLIFNLQKGLNKKYNSGIVQDGKFGDSTAKAMCKNVWTSCYTDVQARNYEVSNAEYNKVVNG